MSSAATMTPGRTPGRKSKKDKSFSLNFGGKKKKSKQKAPLSNRPANLPQIGIERAANTLKSKDIHADHILNVEITGANVRDMVDKVKILHGEARTVLACDLLQRVDAFLQKGDDSTRKALKEEMNGALKEEMETIRIRGAEFKETMEAKADGEWIFAQSMFGVDTYYRLEEGKLYCKVEGKFSNCSSFEQTVVLRECGLFHHWAPFVNKSQILKRHSDYDTTFHFNLAMPLLSRDAVMRGYACEVTEKKTVLVVADSVEQAPPGVELPPKPTAWMTDRMEVKKFRCKITNDSPSSGHVTISAILDPKTNLPASLVNFATKQLVGVLVHLLQEAARKISNDPTKNPHAKKIREDPFYRDVLLPKNEMWCELYKWTMPQLSVLEGLSPVTTPGTGATAAGTPSPAISADAETPQQSGKKKKKRFPSLFSSKKSPALDPSSAPTGTVAALVAMLSPKKSARPLKTPGSSRSKVPPYRRANNPWIFFLILGVYAAIKRSAFNLAMFNQLGLVGEAVLLLVLFQAVVHLSAAFGFFEARYAIKLWDDRKDLSMPAVTAITAGISMAGLALASLAATARTYRVVLVPRDDLPEGGWAWMTTSFMHSWNTICLALFVLLIVRPDAIKKMLH